MSEKLFNDMLFMARVIIERNLVYFAFIFAVWLPPTLPVSLGLLVLFALLLFLRDECLIQHITKELCDKETKNKQHRDSDTSP